MSPSLSTSSFNQDADGNIGVAIHSQSGTVRRVPSVTASLNIDEDGNVGVFGLGTGNTSGGNCDCPPSEPINAYTKNESDARYATSEQGAKANTAVQPGNLKLVATWSMQSGQRPHWTIS